MVFLYLLQILCLLAAIIFVIILPFFLIKRFFYKYALQIYYVFLVTNTVANFHQILVLIYFQIIMLFYLLSCQKINFFLRAIVLLVVLLGAFFNCVPQTYNIEENLLDSTMDYAFYSLNLQFGQQLIVYLYALPLKKLICLFLPFTSVLFGSAEHFELLSCSVNSKIKLITEVAKYHKEYQIPDIKDMFKISPILGNVKNFSSLDLMTTIADEKVFPHFKMHKDLQAKINAFRLANSSFEFQFASRKSFLGDLQNKFSNPKGLVHNLEVTHFSVDDEIFPREYASYFLLEGTKIEANIYDAFHYQIVKNYDSSHWKNNFLKGYVAISQSTAMGTQLAINQGQKLENIVFLPEFIIGDVKNPGDFAIKLEDSVFGVEGKTLYTKHCKDLSLKMNRADGQWKGRVPYSKLLLAFNNLGGYISDKEFEQQLKFYEGRFPVINVKKPL